MAAASDPVSIAILILLMFISSVLVGYVAMFLYARYKRSKGEEYQRFDLHQSPWLDSERKPLIPGNLHTRAVQPVLSDMEEDEEDNRLDALESFKERDYSKLGRIIFVMRYNKKREELMVRLVQIEGLPVSQELYSPHSAYVDVQLKYTGSTAGSDDEEANKPPRLDICLQQVYYFIISTQQMMSHSLEFQINTFDDQFRRFVSGLVEVNLCEELGSDILTGNEVVFVKEILEPFRYSEEQKFEDDDFVSAVSELEDNRHHQQLQTHQEENENETEEDEQEKDKNLKDDKGKTVSRGSSMTSSQESIASNMSWEPEVSQDLLSISMNSLFQRWSSEQDLTGMMMNTLTQDKRAHSVGYLPTYEWTVKEISLDDEQDVQPTATTTIENADRHCDEEEKTPVVDKANTFDYYKLYDDIQGEEDSKSTEHFAKPPPESFYRIVPDTPFPPENNIIKPQTETTSSVTASPNVTRRVAYKKHVKRKLVGRSLSITKKRPSSMKNKQKPKKLEKSGNALERSSSWPSLHSDGTPTAASNVASPPQVRRFFPESSV